MYKLAHNCATLYQFLDQPDEEQPKEQPIEEQPEEETTSNPVKKTVAQAKVSTPPVQTHEDKQTKETVVQTHHRLLRQLHKHQLQKHRQICLVYKKRAPQLMNTLILMN